MPCATKAAPAAVVLKLAEPARARLRQALRAKNVPAAADGPVNSAIAREPKASVTTVRRWWGRFVSGGRPLSTTRNGWAGLVPMGPRWASAWGPQPPARPRIPESPRSHRRIAAQVAGTAFAAISMSRVNTATTWRRSGPPSCAGAHPTKSALPAQTDRSTPEHRCHVPYAAASIPYLTSGIRTLGAEENALQGCGPAQEGCERLFGPTCGWLSPLLPWMSKRLAREGPRG